MMGAGKRKQNFKGGAPAGPSSTTLKQTTRNLKKDQLGGVIFGCTNNTINECLSKQIFGLPAQHFSYVKNIDPGLPLFLFNYSKRVLHGIFEAASPGQMNINPYGWTMDGLERTSYPAQVQIRTRINCHPISENQFAPIIKDNYYTHNHFWFELDYAQASKLISLFSTQAVPVAPSASVIRNVGSWQTKPKRPSKLGIEEDKGITPSVPYCTSAPSNHSNRDLSLTNPSSCLGGIHDRVGCDTNVTEDDQREGINENSQKLSVYCEQDSSPKSHESSSVSQLQDSANVNRSHTEGNNLQKTEMAQVENVKDSPLSSSDIPSIIAQVAKLMQEVQELKTFKQEHISKLSQLEQKQVKSDSDIQQLKDRCTVLEYFSNQEAHGCGAMTESYSEQPLDSDDTIFLVGGYDGESWLSSLDLYSPSNDIIKSLKPMSSVRSYTSVAKLNDNLYVIGGGAGSSWYDTVESYNTVKDNWRLLPCLNAKKGSLAAATLNDKIFAIGGGNGQDSFSDVEMFDLNVGRWISARPMLQKRFALGAVELNGSLYAVGGYDGKHYLRSGERFDPREHSWSKIESMNTSRGGHSLVVLNEKLYAIGGFDGSCLVASVEVFDPRRGTWMTNTPMNLARGYSAAVVLSNAVYIIGGWEGNDNIADKVERYEESHGWQLTNLKAIGKRCYASAIVP